MGAAACWRKSPSWLSFITATVSDLAGRVDHGAYDQLAPAQIKARVSARCYKTWRRGSLNTPPGETLKERQPEEVLAVTGPPLPKAIHIEGHIEPAGVNMRSQNRRICRYFAEARLPDLAIRVGEVPGSNPGAPI